jgi:hypothetical protein
MDRRATQGLDVYAKRRILAAGGRLKTQAKPYKKSTETEKENERLDDICEQGPGD